MKELREGNNNIDADCTTSNSDDVEEGYQVKITLPETRVCAYDDAEAESPSSVIHPHLRTRQNKSQHRPHSPHRQHSHLNPSCPTNSNSNSNSNARSKDTSAATGAGAVFGLSTSADRAARVVSPILGGVLIHHCSTAGLVVLISASACYALALLFYGQSIRCIGLTSLMQDGSVYGKQYIMHASSVVEKALQSVQVKRGLDTEVLYYGGDKRNHEKYL